MCQQLTSTIIFGIGIIYKDGCNIVCLFCIIGIYNSTLWMNITLEIRDNDTILCKEKAIKSTHHLYKPVLQNGKTKYKKSCFFGGVVCFFN